MISYTCGAFDILRATDLRKLDRDIQIAKERGDEYFGVGVYDDNVCEIQGLGKPLKSLEDRMQIMKQIRGVDFVFPVYSLQKSILTKSAKESIEKLHEEKAQKKDKEPKKYQIVYAPGTYDLFHAGHLENLMIAANNGNKLIVGVKSNDLVQKHKNKNPVLSDYERAEILEHFKFVYDTYVYYTRDLHVAQKWIVAKYGSLDAVYLGSDLKKDFKRYADINIEFTERDPKAMQKYRSTTAISEQMKKREKTYKEPKIKITRHTGRISLPASNRTNHIEENLL